MCGAWIHFRSFEDVKMEASKVPISMLKPQVWTNLTKWFRFPRPDSAWVVIGWVQTQPELWYGECKILTRKKYQVLRLGWKSGKPYQTISKTQGAGKFSKAEVRKSSLQNFRGSTPEIADFWNGHNLQLQNPIFNFAKDWQGQAVMSFSSLTGLHSKWHWAWKDLTLLWFVLKRAVLERICTSY